MATDKHSARFYDYIAGTAEAGGVGDPEGSALDNGAVAATAATGTGFDGDLVTLGIYYPNLVAGDLENYGSAVVVAGTTTFPNVLSLPQANAPPPDTYIIGSSVDFTNTDILINYPATYEGVTTLTSPFNGFQFATAAGDAPITGVALKSTNIRGLTNADLTFSAHTIDLNLSDLTLPVGVLPSIDVTATFGAAPPPLTVLDTTTGQSITATGTAYVGPVAGLQEEYINLTTDSLNITATTPNWFIAGGSGENGIAVTSGNNIIDGGDGSNFLTGGTGHDSFYLDDRAPTAPIFSTIVNFHSGDNVTVWGVNATDFTLLELNGQGAIGYTGLDFIFSAAGHPATSFVLAGYTSADLAGDSGERLSDAACGVTGYLQPCQPRSAGWRDLYRLLAYIGW
jgi:hypothetical protein